MNTPNDRTLLEPPAVPTAAPLPPPAPGISAPPGGSAAGPGLSPALRLLEALASEGPGTLSTRQLEVWRAQVSRLQAAARELMILCDRIQRVEATQPVAGTPGRWDEAPAESSPPDRAGAPRPGAPAVPASDFRCTYMRQHDYWTVEFAGQTAFLKSTRGLECLSCLLRSPGREFHVSELLTTVPDASGAAERPSIRNTGPVAGQKTVASGLNDGCPLLDAQARSEYRLRLNELRLELAEAEGFNDPHRASTAREELEALTQHFAAAVGLGGRDRKTSSDAERARSAVTKRIKHAIRSIADAIPALGDHLGNGIKTGYFCSYRPPVICPVTWKF